MRHVPTALYIDTEVFNRNGFRLDTKGFNSLKDTFMKGGIRLLIPAVMERELLRQYLGKSDKLATKLSGAHKEYQKCTPDVEKLPSKDELSSKTYEGFVSRWNEFKEHFTVEALPLLDDIEAVVDQYFSVLPPFSASKPKEFPDAFILSVLKRYHRENGSNIAVISADGDFKTACNLLRYIQHFNDLKDYVAAFEPELSSDSISIEPLDPTKPITTEDLTELKAILKRGDDATQIEVQRVMGLLEARGTNYDYFFGHAADKIWFKPLKDSGYFKNPPKAEDDIEGQRRSYWWPPLLYLIRVYDKIPDEVLNVVETLPVSDNSRVLEGIVDIVLKANKPEVTLRLKDHILAYVDHASWDRDRLVGLLKMPFLFSGELTDFSESLLLKIVEYRPDPQTREKQLLRKSDKDAWGTSLEPQPKFDSWVYQEVLRDGVYPLAEKEPYQVARIMIDATTSLLRLRAHDEDRASSNGQDLSEIWCPRLDEVTRSYGDEKQMLVKTLTDACEKVYEASPEMIEPLDQALRNSQWLLFKRLRQHLYANFPTKQVLPWIREFILGHEGYNNRDIHYEMQQMIRNACLKFDHKLLSKDELSAIVKSIKSGPPQAEFREWLGADYTDEKYQQRRHYFHRKQLRPFEPILIGEDAEYYQELSNEFKDDSLEDDSYAPYGEVKSGSVSEKSPIDAAGLASKSDEELLRFINEWDKCEYLHDDDFTEITFNALAHVFRKIFTEEIIPNADRLNFWIENRDRIGRPVYVRSIVEAIKSHVKGGNYEQLDRYFDFCGWVLTHSEDAMSGDIRPQEESMENPDWSSSRRAVGDFIEACLSEDHGVPPTAREDIAKLLELLCTQFSYQLDENHPVILNRNDQLTEAINITRSRALETLVVFGHWVRRNNEEAQVPEVMRILEERFADDTKYPLTLPEYSILASRYVGIFSFDPQWATENKGYFFPQENLPAWREAFGCLLQYSRPFIPVYEALHDDFVFALDQIFESSGENNSSKLIESLGQQLFTYYLWDVFPLNGEDSLLERYYNQTSADRNYWATLFNHVGRSFNNSRPDLDPELTEKAKNFFEWRLGASEPQELSEFTFWFRAKCFDAEWRLDCYLEILDITQASDIKITLDLETLRGLLDVQTAKVVECLAKLTESAADGKGIYFRPDDVRAILKAGFNSKDPDIYANAELAKENLLRAGRHEFLDDE